MDPIDGIWVIHKILLGHSECCPHSIGQLKECHVTITTSPIGRSDPTASCTSRVNHHINHYQPAVGTYVYMHGQALPAAPPAAADNLAPPQCACCMHLHQ